MTPYNYDPDSDDDYPYYRGMKFRFNSKGRVYWRTPLEQSVAIEVSKGLKSVTKKLLKIRPEGGSFRITEAREVLIKIKRDNDSPDVPKFVGTLDKEITFNTSSGNLDNNPSDLEPGDLWTGIYDGTRLSFLRSPEPKIWWNTVEDFNVRYLIDLTHTPLPDNLVRELSYWKPLGGSFRVTMDGHIITLIDPKQRIPKHKEQFEQMNDVQQLLVDVKEERTKMFAVYIGKWEMTEKLSFIPPRRIGEPLTKERRSHLDNLFDLGLKGGGESAPSSSFVPVDAEPDMAEISDFLNPSDLIPGAGDFAVLELNMDDIEQEEE